MIIKEFKRMLVPLAVRVGFTLAVGIFMGIFFRVKDRNFSLLMGIMYFFSWTFGFTMLWIANYLGNTAFRDEQKDNAYEYLFTFPISRLKILLNKMIPGIVALMVLLAGFGLLFYFILKPLIDNWQTAPMIFQVLFNPFLLPVWSFFIYISAFMVGFFDWKDVKVIINYVHLTFFFTITHEIGKILKPLLNPVNTPAGMFPFSVTVFITGILVVLLLLSCAFFPVYLKFDMKGMEYHRKRFIRYGLAFLFGGYAILKIWNTLN